MKKSFPIIGEKQSCSTAPGIHTLPGGGMVPASQFKGRAAVVTLGCAKNQVDSEVMLGVLRNTGYEIVSEVERADVAIVNTCGFLESAVQESIDCILDIAELKESGQLRKLIVAGCAVSRYRGDIREALPEVDSFVSLDDILNIGSVASSDATDLFGEAARPYFLYDETTPRELSSLPHTAYVKISEGCNRPCTFCIIPTIRGAFRSRTIDSVVSEVVSLGSRGVREINLVAQDLTAFGSDRKGEGIVDLLRALDDSQSVDRIRLLYAYPVGISDELLDAIVELPRICTYLDLPLQHASESILRAMKRPVGRFATRPLVEHMRSRQPKIALRTTFIVGFPGETEKDIVELESLVAEGHFASVGVFAYSAEEGTPAFQLKDQVPERLKEERRNRIMEAQRKVVEAQNAERIGNIYPVLIDGPHEDSDLLLTGRTSFQAPEVDGIVIINDAQCDPTALVPGSIWPVEITEIAGYDLVGSALSESNMQSASALAAS